MLFLLPSLILLQTGSKTISLSQSALPLPALLQKVSAQTGVNLQCAAQMKDDIVCVDLTNCTLDDFKKHLASAECATWSNDGTSAWINIDAQKQSAAITDYNNTIAKAVQKDLEMQTKIKADPSVSSDSSQATVSGSAVGASAVGAAAADMMMGAENPDFCKALLAIGALNLINTGAYNRIVFSNQPTAMQYQIPAAADSIIESKLLPEAIKALKPNQGQIVKYDLSSSNSMSDSMFQFQLQFFASNGDSVKDYATSSFGGDFSAFQDPSTPPKVSTPTGNKIVVPADVLALSGSIGLSNESTSKSKLTPDPTVAAALKALMKTPAKVDPLTWASKLLIAAAQASQKNFIAVLPDPVFEIVNRASAKNLTDEVIFNSVKQEYGCKVDTSSPSWIEVRPNDPSEARQGRMSREFLQNLVDYELANETPSIVSLAQIAAHLDRQFDIQNLAIQYIAPFRPSWAADFFTQSFDFMALYGSLSDSERSSLADGTGLSLSGLSDAARARISKMLYSQSSNLSVVQTKEDKSNPFEGMFEAFGGQAKGVTSADGIRAEPTEVCPNGLPGNGTLEGKLANSEVQKLITKKSAPKDMAEGLSNFGMPNDMLLAMFSMPSAMQGGADNSQSFESIIDGFSAGHRQSLDMRVYVSKGLFMTGSIHHDDFPKDAPIVSLADYKKAHQAEIDKFKAQWDKAMKDIGDAVGAEKSGP